MTAYLIWAGFPIYFALLGRSGPGEIIAYRVLCSLAFCLLVTALLRRWGELLALLRHPRLVAALGLAGWLVALNWLLFVWGVTSDRTLDAALGYFLNPLIAAFLGVMVLGERLGRMQWVAFGVGALACVVLIVGYGHVPWIAFGVSASFGVYGLIKKRIGPRVPALAGLTVETAAVAPVAGSYLVWLAASDASTVALGTGYGWLVLASGPLTAIPLLLFAAAAKRIRLVTLGMIQYLAPIGQFLVGWLVFGEPMPLERWIGFSLVWLALALFVGARTTRDPAAPIPDDGNDQGRPPGEPGQIHRQPGPEAQPTCSVERSGAIGEAE